MNRRDKATQRTLEYLEEQARVNPGLLLRAIKIWQTREEAGSEAVQEAFRRVLRAEEERRAAMEEVVNVATRIGMAQTLLETLKQSQDAEAAEEI